VVERYGYDANGNRTSARYGDDAAQPATYDRQDRLTSRAGIVHTPNADGFLAARGGDAFTYSAAGELLSATVGSRTVTYAYDGMGRRVARTEGGATERYLYGNPDERFQITAVRSTGGELSVLHYDDQGLLFAIERGGRRYYVATDQVGTPRVVTDDAGAVLKRLDHDAFGRVLSDSNPAWELPIGFAGGLADPATGLVRLGLRDYDAAAGRWTARDPIRFGGGQGNLYAYAGSDPVNHRDTSGMNRGCDCPFQTSLNELKNMTGFAARAPRWPARSQPASPPGSPSTAPGTAGRASRSARARTTSPPSGGGCPTRRAAGRTPARLRPPARRAPGRVAPIAARHGAWRPPRRRSPAGQSPAGGRTWRLRRAGGRGGRLTATRR
jgi:RHS repeat-associated protein